MHPTAILRLFAITILALSGARSRASAQPDSVPVEVVISVPDQRMVVLREGGWIKKYRVSTSRFGIGDNHGSYKTPLGRMRVWEKLGGALPSGSVLKHREATGEILPVNAPGRDPIVSRILWLEGLESQNDNARGRGIYIHGTTEESHIGKAVSWGCIRMRSEDVIELYDILPVGATVTITEEELPRFSKWKPPLPVVIASFTEPLPFVTPSRAVPERISPVAELLRPKDERTAPADGGVANAFRGSILFAGLTTAPKSAAKPVQQSRAAAKEALTLGAVPLSHEGFSLRVTTAVPPLGLIDLRRGALPPWVGSTSIFDAPVPALAFMGKSDRETISAAASAPTHPLF